MASYFWHLDWMSILFRVTSDFCVFIYFWQMWVDRRGKGGGFSALYKCFREGELKGIGYLWTRTHVLIDVFRCRFCQRFTSSYLCSIRIWSTLHLLSKRALRHGPITPPLCAGVRSCLAPGAETDGSSSCRSEHKAPEQSLQSVVPVLNIDRSKVLPCYRAN